MRLQQGIFRLVFLALLLMAALAFSPVFAQVGVGVGLGTVRLKEPLAPGGI